MKENDGFTLIELLVATTILVIVLGAVATAFITATRTASGLTDRYSRSFDAAALERYWTTDVETSDDVTPTPGTVACNSATGTIIVRFTNTDSSAATDIDKTTDYVWDSTTTTLSRITCSTVSGTTTNGTTRLSALVKASPTATCSPACTGSSRPQSVQLALTYTAGGTDAEALSFSSTADRRLYP